MINRRLFMSVAAVTGTLTACATFDANAGKVAQQVSLFATGLQGIFQELGNVPGINVPANVLTITGSAIASIQALATQIASASTTAAQQPLMQKILTYANTVFSVLIPALALIPGIPQAISLGLTAAQALLPVILSLVGIVTPPSASAPTMDPVRAQLILSGFAAKVK